MRGEKGKIGAVGLEEEEEEEVGVCEGRLWTLIFGPLVMTGNYVSTSIVHTVEAQKNDEGSICMYPYNRPTWSSRHG